jgi:hypothetical protein
VHIQNSIVNTSFVYVTVNEIRVRSLPTIHGARIRATVDLLRACA